MAVARGGKSILVVSHNPELADVRKRVLEEEGYQVLPADNLEAVRSACENGNIDLVIIGYSLPPSDKRRVALAARENCKVPVLELFQGEEPDLLRETWLYYSQMADDLVRAVRHVFASR